MTGYLQRLLDRSQPAPAPSGATGGDAPVARPAMPSRSPIAAADQRLNDPNLAALIGTTPPTRTGDAGLFGPEPETGDISSGRSAAESTGYIERSVRRVSKIRDRAESALHSTPTPKSGREEPQSRLEPSPPPLQPPASPSVDEPNSQPATPPPVAPLPAEHPLRRLDVDIIRPPAEAPPMSDRTPTPETAPDSAMSPVPDLRLVEDPDSGLTDVTAPRPDHPPSTEPSEAALPETEPHRAAEAEPQTVEPPPPPAAPPPPRPEPETIVIEKTEPAAQVAPTEQPKPETTRPEPAERPRPGPKTAAAASLIGPLPQRMRVRTLFGVRRR